jgi:hypothetical protein
VIQRLRSLLVNEIEAKEEGARLAAEHPDRHTHRWVPTKREGGWFVAKIGLPPVADDTTAELRADERPSTPDDVRDCMPFGNTPPPWFGA